MDAHATVLPPKYLETEKTNTTDSVSNAEFLQTVFGANPSDARPVVVSFNGDPARAPSKHWFGVSWQDISGTPNRLPASANNYFSLAAFLPDEAGHFRRQKTRFHALYAVMLDDIGTKVASERLTLPPSWLLETSPGNHQAGYLLRVPLTNGTDADHLMDAIVAASLCDPGANGPRTRLARLPNAVNGKHSPPFQCRLIEWSPELRYSVDELVDGLQLEMASAGRPQRRNPRPRSPSLGSLRVVQPLRAAAWAMRARSFRAARAMRNRRSRR